MDKYLPPKEYFMTDLNMIQVPQQIETSIPVELFNQLITEIQKGDKWPKYNSCHEGLGVLMEEFDELKQHVYTNQKRRDIAEMRIEALQVAAVAIRFARDLCNEVDGRK